MIMDRVFIHSAFHLLCADFESIAFLDKQTRSYLKIKILVQDQGGGLILAAGILKYVEDLN